MIKCESVDFQQLVNENTTLSLSTQTKMVELLNNTFTDEETRWYIGNLYMYMNYHATNDYPIDLENVLKMLGFAHKKNAKRTLEKILYKEEIIK